MTSLKNSFITAALVGLLNSHYAIAVDAYVTAEFIPDVMTPNKKNLSILPLTLDFAVTQIHTLTAFLMKEVSERILPAKKC